MEEILHQLIGRVYSIIYRVFYMPGGAGFQPSTVLNLYKWVERLLFGTSFFKRKEKPLCSDFGKGYIAEAYLVAHGT